MRRILPLPVLLGLASLLLIAAARALPAMQSDFYSERATRQEIGEFQQFLDDGGYRDPKYWRYPFRKDGGEIRFAQAAALFRDSTGRPGPAGWELGRFPKDQADFPVSGVSWFEAGAYCAYVGKALPTVHHWRKAAGFGIYSDILLFSNFASAGPARVGAHTGISGFGAYDMAGNVKEWC
ncbi:MAG: formylglycine-generating enzyme family protein, partial [Acidobacteriia bacterium]|nr:formylglycine-generating enzyme family protein [Terriglobia bacterium]